MNALPCAEWLASIADLRVSLATVANLRCHTIAVLAAVTACRLTFSGRRDPVAFVASALLWSGAVTVLTATQTSRHAEFSVRLESESLIAPAGVVTVTCAIAAHYRARGETKAREIPHVVGKADASIGCGAEAINALVFADGIAFSKVVNIPAITFAAHLNAR